MIHPTQTEVYATAPRVAGLPPLPEAKSDVRKERCASCRSDPSIDSYPEEVIAAPTFPGRQLVATRGRARADRKQTIFAWRCGQLRELILRASPAWRPMLLRRVALETVQKVFQCS